MRFATALALTATLLASGCGKPEPSTYSRLTVDRFDRSPERLAVQGSSDLPDWAKVRVHLIEGTDPGSHPIEVAEASVIAGSFSTTFRAPAWRMGRNHVVEALFVPTDQSDAVLEKVGPKGERLADSGHSAGRLLGVSTLSGTLVVPAR